MLVDHLRLHWQLLKVLGLDTNKETHDSLMNAKIVPEANETETCIKNGEENIENKHDIEKQLKFRRIDKESHSTKVFPVLVNLWSLICCFFFYWFHLPQPVLSAADCVPDMTSPTPPTTCLYPAVSISTSRTSSPSQMSEYKTRFPNQHYPSL